MNDVQVYPDKRQPWFRLLKFDYHAELKEEIKRVPGSNWVPSRKAWRVPVEMLKPLSKVAAQYGFRLKHKTGLAAVPQIDESLLEGLYPYQKNGAVKAITEGRWIFNDETGVGKSVQAIVAARGRGSKSILIVCPAIVRANWLRELDKWWPGHPEVGLIDVGPDRKGLSKKKVEERERAYKAAIQIVSYDLLAYVVDGGYDTIIFDEVHRVKSSKSKTAVACQKIVEAATQGNAAVYGLSATVMPDKPGDVHNLLNTIWPDRFGGHWVFSHRYTNAFHNGYGWNFSGVNATYQEEFALRLGACMSRTTRKEIADLLPPFDVTCLRTKDKDRMRVARDWYEDAYANNTHVCILVHERHLARQLAHDLGGAVITGEILPEKRDKLLQEAIKSDRATVVATIDSISEGIDMTAFTATLIAQMHWWVKAMVQILGRFSRLSGELPTHVDILVREGTVDERIAMKLEDNLADINSVCKAGTGESKLETILSRYENEEEALEDLKLSLQIDSEDDLMALLSEGI